MKVFSIEPLKRFLCGTTAQPVSLQKQISRLITFCCVAVVLIQSSILASMLFHQYIRQEKEDTLYILENTHTKINSGFQYMEDLVLILQDQTGLQDFFRTGDFDADAAAERLKTSASLFSERNQMSSSEPLIEKIYLFNFFGDSIYNLYYPVTLSKIEAEQEKQLNFETRKEYYTSDSYIEQVAREQLGMVKPNEIIYINRSE